MSSLLIFLDHASNFVQLLRGETDAAGQLRFETLIGMESDDALEMVAQMEI